MNTLMGLVLFCIILLAISVFLTLRINRSSLANLEHEIALLKTVQEAWLANIADYEKRLESLELAAKLQHRQQKERASRPRGWRQFLNEYENGVPPNMNVEEPNNAERAKP